MKIGYLGTGTWGFSLASLLASKGFEVYAWGVDCPTVMALQTTRIHPKLPGAIAHPNVTFGCDFEEAVADADVIVESVTSQGIRPVFQRLAPLKSEALLVITSKGIELGTGLLLPEIVLEVMGEGYRSRIGCLSGPSHAEEVVKQLPTSVVAAAYAENTTMKIRDIFSTSFFRVYPNADIHGVAFGGAMKNIIAIACGIAVGLGLGDNTVAALMTRGLHEIRKLAVVKGAKPETLNGLSGLGDLCVTCLSHHSRNSRFGRLIGEGLGVREALGKVGMVVEGMTTCKIALNMAREAQIEVPITEVIHAILYEQMDPKNGVKQLLNRAVKEEHL